MNLLNRNPLDLLIRYSYFHNKDDIGSKYMATAIEKALTDKGYTIETDGNTYSLKEIPKWANEHEELYSKLLNKQIEKQLSKQRNMKNIVIKFENNNLVNYTINKIIEKLNVNEPEGIKEVNISNTSLFTALIIKDKVMTIVQYANHNDVSFPKDAKYFHIINASNTDSTIKQVVEEYNKSEYETILIGGNYNHVKAQLELHEKHVIVAGSMHSYEFTIEWFKQLLRPIGGMYVGGDNMILFTVNSEKIYVYKTEIADLIHKLQRKKNGFIN